jgi:hypothetical protein
MFLRIKELTEYQKQASLDDDIEQILADPEATKGELREVIATLQARITAREALIKTYGVVTYFQPNRGKWL